MLENNVLRCHYVYVLLFIIKLNQLIFGIQILVYEPDFSLCQQSIYCTCKRGSPVSHSHANMACE